jgi:hypothetical protein
MFVRALAPQGGRYVCGMPARLFLIRLIAPLVGIGIAAAVIFTRKDGSNQNYTSFGIICVVLIVALLVSQWQRARRLRALRAMNDAAANGNPYVIEAEGQGPANVPVAVPVGVITAPAGPQGSPAHGYPHLQYGYNTPVAAMAVPSGLSGYPQHGYPAASPAPSVDEDPNPIRSTSIAIATPVLPSTTSVDVVCGRLNAATSPESLIAAMSSYCGGAAPNSFATISECATNVRTQHPENWTHDVALAYGQLLQQIRSGAHVSTL